MEWMDVRKSSIENMISTKKHRYLKTLSDFKPGDKFQVKPLEWFDEQEKTIFTSFGPSPGGHYCKEHWVVEDPEGKGTKTFTEFMSEYCGKYMTFAETNPDGTACAAEDGGVHLWEDWMVEF